MIWRASDSLGQVAAEQVAKTLTSSLLGPTDVGAPESFPVVRELTDLHQRAEHPLASVLFQVEESSRLRQGEFEPRHFAELSPNPGLEVDVFAAAGDCARTEIWSVRHDLLLSRSGSHWAIRMPARNRRRQPFDKSP
jgi:hypothetical protein